MRCQLTLVAFLLGGFIAAGCGGDEDESAGATTDSNLPSRVAKAVEECKQSVAAAPSLSAELKGDLEQACQDAGEDGEDAVSEATKEACVKVLEATMPPGPARESALGACG